MRLLRACLPVITLFLLPALGMGQIPPPTTLAGIAHVLCGLGSACSAMASGPQGGMVPSTTEM